jgi:hypothetical protein
MTALVLYPRILGAQTVDVRSLVGEDWYGVYLNGHKSGYQVNTVAVANDGTASFTEDAHLKVTMAGAPQDMRIFSKHTYAPDGALRSIEAQVDDPRASTKFACKVEGESMTMNTIIGNEVKQTRLPKPKETLQDALKHVRLLNGAAKVGDKITYSFFEPLSQRELTAESEIAGVEDRVFEGVTTKVYRIHTRTPELGIDSESYVSENGKTLEDIIVDKFKMRLEPKEIAVDVSYSNDVIVSNAAVVKDAVENPRTRDSLSLLLKGPLAQEHLFNDERQTILAKDGGFEFVGRKVSLKGLKPLEVPVMNPEVQKWREPSTFVQSDNPELIRKAKEIVGDEKDALKISEKLCRWVYANVHTIYSARLTNALEVLKNLEGDCTEHSVLFVGLARAAGLPAREVAGLIYVDASGGAPKGFYFHQWATVWVGKWVDVDPTFNQPQADVTHIKLAEGDLFTQARLLPLIGQIQVEVEDPK